MAKYCTTYFDYFCKLYFFEISKFHIKFIKIYQSLIKVKSEK